MSSHLRLAVALALCALLAFGGGCNGKPSAAQQAKKAGKAKTEQDAKADLPGEVNGKGWRIRWKERDPDHPDDRSRPLLDADAENGKLLDQGKDDLMLLENVKAKLYRDGKLSARIEAPEMTAQRNQRVVTGMGGVTLTSLTDPPDTIVTADKMAWDTRTSKIVATGNVYLTRTPPKGAATTQTLSRLTFDTRLKDFEGG